MVVLTAVEWHGDSAGADKLVGVQTLQLSSEETADLGHWYWLLQGSWKTCSPLGGRVGAFIHPAKTMRQLSPLSCQDGCPGKALLPVAAYYLDRDDQNWYPHMQQQGAFQSLGQEFMVSKGQDTPGQALLQS